MKNGSYLLKSEKQNKSDLSRILGLILTVSFLAVWLVTSVRLVLYSDVDLYRAEYENTGY